MEPCPEGEIPSFSSGPDAWLDSNPTGQQLHCTTLTIIPLPDKPTSLEITNPPSHPVFNRSSPIQAHSNTPLLLTSVSHADGDESHSSLVDRVKLALHSPRQHDFQMEDGDDEGSLLGSDDPGSPLEPEDDMLLSHYQKDVKLEALARRAPNKNKSCPKKGRSTS